MFSLCSSLSLPEAEKDDLLSDPKLKRKMNIPLLGEVVVNLEDMDDPEAFPVLAGGGRRNARVIARNRMRKQIIA
ncbi:hypothetical protein E2C01_087675 [Portunus trituberculatus]|uniref:Uncharacterized protein n=1 Tax=Portunus trituberculatus TaxID=210409 RepID=A0A5B7JCA6_PORTR|nr:hypothetical protein [Portunus trituberculatus]